MAQIKLAFYRDGQSKVSRFIRWVTRSEHYSHVEIIIGSVWVTALIGHGVVSRRYNPSEEGEEYDYITVEVPEENWHEAVEFINGIEEDKMYDYFGAMFGNMLNIPLIQDPNKYFCAEVVADVLHKFGEPKIKNRGSSHMTPQKLYDLYKEQ